MECKICGSVQIKGDCQYINGYYYHNHCIEKLVQENKELHNKIDKYEELEQRLNFIKNRVKQGMTQENINKCAIQLVNSYLKDSDVDE